MKKTLKVFASIAVFILAILAVFAINATDEKQTELTQQMLQKFPAQDGFALKEFKLAAEERVPNIDFDKYSDYTKDPERYDTLIGKYKKALNNIQKAFAVGHVSVNPDDTFFDGTYFYRPNDHRLFLAYLSQEIQHGKTSESLKLLEQSNRFLASIAESPQTIISKLISISLLKKNAEFTKELLEEKIIKKTPLSLKESFNITETPEQMWDESSRREFQMVSTVITGPLDGDMFDATSVFTEAPSSSDRFLKPVLGWLYPKLIRRNQTLNMMSGGYAALSKPECLKSDSTECTYYEETTGFKLGNFFINPVGRSLTKILLPKFYGVRQKFHTSTGALKELVATL